MTRRPIKNVNGENFFTTFVLFFTIYYFIHAFTVEIFDSWGLYWLAVAVVFPTQVWFASFYERKLNEYYGNDR